MGTPVGSHVLEALRGERINQRENAKGGLVRTSVANFFSTSNDT